MVNGDHFSLDGQVAVVTRQAPRHRPRVPDTLASLGAVVVADDLPERYQ
jgi:hypothetical protein